MPTGVSRNKMLDILLIVLAVIAVSIIIAFRAGVRQHLLNQLTTTYNEAADVFRSCTNKRLPAELQYVLRENLRKMSLSLIKIENILKTEQTIFRLRQIIEEDKPYLAAVTAEVKDICEHWNKYAAYKQQLSENLKELSDHINKINDKTEVLIRKDESCQEIIQARAAGILVSLEEYKTQFQELASVKFEEYTTELTVPQIADDLLGKARILIEELSYYNHALKVYLTGLYRKSVYYLTMEDSKEKSTRRYAGSVQVSYKTFCDVNKGDPYKWDIIIGQKYTTGEQNMTVKSYKKEKLQANITYQLTKEQFAEIFKALPLNKRYEEVSEDGIPYQMNATDLNTLICEKNPHSFDVTYHIDIFSSTSIYDFLSYDSPVPQLFTSKDSQPDKETPPLQTEEADSETASERSGLL